jgi:hypothetical protein
MTSITLGSSPGGHAAVASESLVSAPAADHAVPPVRRSVTVRSDRAHVFDVFVREIGRWWPTRTHSLGGGERIEKVLFEQCLGGRVHEVWDDGTEVDWGRVLLWEPPDRFAITWNVTGVREGGAVTEVEVRFLALGPSLTRVELEHRGWERLAEGIARATEEGYEAGWARILALFADACHAAP